MRGIRGGNNQKPITASMRKCLPCLWAIGFGKKYIAKLTGIHLLTIHRIAKRIGIPPARRKGRKIQSDSRKPNLKSYRQMRFRLEIDEPTRKACLAYRNSSRYYRNIRSSRRKSRKSARKYYQTKVVASPELTLKKRLRSRIWKVCKGLIKAGRTMEMTGCSASELKAFLESKFRDGMSWDNYGTNWHVDHIKPCASFDLSDPEQQRACFHYTNLQPLEANLNRIKNDAVDWSDPFRPSHSPPIPPPFKKAIIG